MPKTKDVIAALQYIASSPPREHGGFHPEAVKAAKDAIELLEQLQTIACFAADYVVCQLHGMSETDIVEENLIDALKNIGIIYVTDEQADAAIAAYDEVKGEVA